MPNVFAVFHLNLAFSSIPLGERSNVINKCYWPLLDLIKSSNVPLGIELTGYTLNCIAQLSPEWLSHFKILLKNEQCEIIGSGYTQVIGPLVPYKVNYWNQKLGLKAYKEKLDVTPSLALINELAYSNQMVNVYADVGYKGIIMEQDNIRISLGMNDASKRLPVYVEGQHGKVMPVLWSDSILFQKFQRVAHGELSLADYLDYFQSKGKKASDIVPIYCNDVEIFDYRPGRFDTESELHPEGEWGRIKKLIQKLSENNDVVWRKPSDALKLLSESNSNESLRLSSASLPIPVKKQAKYNISRWAVSGRNDLWINTMCYRIFHKLLSVKNSENESHWKKLCEHWASDLRTHITEDRWIDAEKSILKFAKDLGVSDVYSDTNKCDLEGFKDIEYGEFNNYKIESQQEDIIICVSCRNVTLKLNRRKGLTIQSLLFRQHVEKVSVVTVPHGFFDSIELGADYFSVGVVVEQITKHKRITDLHEVRPMIKESNGCIHIGAVIKTPIGDLVKTYSIDLKNENVSVFLGFSKLRRIYGTVRINAITLSPELVQDNLGVVVTNGGEEPDIYVLDRDFSHGDPASTLVSAKTGLGATEGEIVFQLPDSNNLRVSWKQAESAIFPMLQYKKSHPGALMRLIFSLSEIDETFREGGSLPNVTFNVSPY